MTDDQYIAGIKQDLRQIEAAFYKLHYGMVEKMVLANSGSLHDAKDLYQESILAVFSKIKKGELDNRTASLKTFLYSVAWNKWKYHLREVKKVHMMVLEGDHPLIDDKYESNEMEEKHRKVEIALEMIDELCERIIKAFYLEKMTMKSMASKFGYKDENSMKKRKSLCMSAVRQNLMSIDHNNPLYHGRLF
jgi:RNA polymerase sigma factor (sigma-70 family)